MAYNPQLADRIRELIASRTDDVEEKSMFGGLCFMVSGKMTVTTREDRIMVRLAPEDYEAAIQKDSCRPMVHGGREMKGFVFVFEGALKTKAQLKRWVDLALDFNETAAKTARKKR